GPLRGWEHVDARPQARHQRARIAVGVAGTAHDGSGAVMIVGEAARGEEEVAALQADESVPDIGRAVVGRDADDARIEPGAPAHLLDERHAGVTGNDDIAPALLPPPGDDLALGGEDETVDQVDAAMDHAQPPAAYVYGQGF